MPPPSSIPLAIAALAALTALAAGPQAKPPEPFFPTRVGTAWVYEREDGKDHPEEIVSAEARGGRLVLSMGRREGGTVTPVWAAAVTGDELLWLRRRDRDLAAPIRLLKLPVTPGDAWTSKAQDGTVSTYSVREAEDVEVPAGKFKAHRIDCDWRQDGKAHRVTDWYAAGVGLVRSTSDGETVRTLKSFTPAKD